VIRDQCLLIFVSLENWDDIWRRNQFVCAELARRYPDMQILFVCPPRDVSNALRTRRLASLRGPNNWHPEGLPNITVTKPLKLLPSTLAVGRWINEFMARVHVRRAAQTMITDHGSRINTNQKLEGNAGVPPTKYAPIAALRQVLISDPCSLVSDRSVVLWLNPHDAVHMVGRMGETRVIYDITDDWTQFTHFTDRRALLDRTIAEDALLCRKADAVIVCSKSLYESRKALARDIHLIPNGVDAAHYRCVLDDHGPLPEACRNWPRPVFGYTGSIHGDRVDVKLVEAMTVAMKAKNIPGTIVLIGPVMLPMQDRQRLEATGRVIFTGPMAYRDLPQYMRAFDVCIVPHCMTAFVESLNPIKLWEYLAAGKPIVSTDVAGFRDYPHLVRTARTADEFLSQCQAAVAEGSEKSELRRAEAGKHSWRSRVDEIVNVMVGCGETVRAGS
jgi:glycosyltransferase involved in cell wall biosynthesis